MAERDLAQIKDCLLSSWSSKRILHAPYVHRALHWARLGQLGIAIKAMSSSGVADHEDELVQDEILKRHPKGPVLLDADLPDLTPAITVTDHLVLKALKAFRKGSSPGGFQLRAQHLLDAVSGFTAPVSQDCLHQLTCLVNFLLSGKAPHLVGMSHDTQAIQAQMKTDDSMAMPLLILNNNPSFADFRFATSSASNGLRVYLGSFGPGTMFTKIRISTL